MPHKRLESVPNASIRFQTDNKRFQTAIFLWLGDLFSNFALRGGPIRPHKNEAPEPFRLESSCL